MTIAVDGVLIELLAGLQLQQSYEHVPGGFSLRRSRNGKALPQSRWRKMKTTIQGGGWRPAAIAALDTTIPHVIDCIAPRIVPIGTVVVERPDVPGIVVDEGYQYWPRLTGYITLTEQLDARGAVYGWTLTLEEE